MFNVKSIPTLPIGIHCYERGVYLRVTTHSRSWLYKYQLNGKRRELGLGSAEQPLSAVLAKVAPLKALVAQGIDPKDKIAEEKAEKKAAEVKASMPTFSEYADHAFEKILYLRGFTGAKNTEAAWRCDINRLKGAFGEAAAGCNHPRRRCVFPSPVVDDETAQGKRPPHAPLRRPQRREG